MKNKIKNYLILLGITIVTVFGVLYVEKLYSNKKEYEMKNTPLHGAVSEVNTTDLESYILENPNIIIYLTSSSNAKIKEFEKNLRKIVVKDSLNKDLIYLDIDKVENDKFYSDFSNKYFSKGLKDKKISLGKYPNMLSIREGIVVEILYPKKADINYNDAKQFIEIHQLVGDND